MVALTVNSHDFIDAENIVFFASDIKRNGQSFISLSRTEKTRSYIVCDDNTVYATGMSLKLLEKRFKEAFKRDGTKLPALFKVTPYAYCVAKNISLITDSITPTLKKLSDKIEHEGQMYALNKTAAKQKRVVRINDDTYKKEKISVRAKSFVFIQGQKEMFLLKSNFSTDTLLKHIKENSNANIKQDISQN